ncbi:MULTISPECIES: tape measure protein [unclassified Sphingomonas]|uniref:tape measure protein n=1 Tax=unclassified Sphingomonas TaxID=196159 RepID=UPI00083453D7|nr:MULTISPECIES: tape measure protein [unclassified Sphingomonas]
MTLKTSLILDAKDRASRIVQRVNRATEQLRTRGVTPLGRAMEATNRVSGRFLTGLPTRLATLQRRTAQLAGRAGMRGLELSAYGAGYAIGALIRKAATLSLTLAKLAGGAAVFGAGWLTGGIIKTAMAFEQFQVVLENTEGSAQKAREAMDWVKTFAKTTPYEIGDVMGAFVALKAFGIDPVNGSLRSLGNAASGMNKPLMQAVEMLADAQTGEFERLKEFGVRASKQGERVSFTYMKAGREITRTAKMSGVEIQRALIGIFDERFNGMMDRQSRTLAGMWSNLMDSVANFQLDVANAGFFDVLKGRAEQLLQTVNRLAADGTLTRWAEEISDRLEKMVDYAWKFATETNWSQVGADLRAVADAAWLLVRALASAVRLAQDFSKYSRLTGSPTSALGLSLAEQFLPRGQKPAPRPRAPMPAANVDGRGALWNNAIRPRAPEWPGMGAGPVKPGTQTSKADVTLKIIDEGGRSRVVGMNADRNTRLSIEKRGRTMAMPA